MGIILVDEYVYCTGFRPLKYITFVRSFMLYNIRVPLKVPRLTHSDEINSAILRGCLAKAKYHTDYKCLLNLIRRSSLGDRANFTKTITFECGSQTVYILSFGETIWFNSRKGLARVQVNP